MSYIALARKFRPQSFDQFIGQEHAIKALKQALSRKQIHHAYLFTGTRGVGKTSVARLFAKALSCEKGIKDNPCLQCNNCKAIQNANFLDLIEIDAASKTKVEDTRELLSQVNYPPVQGRFKIYLIDEVHMLSTHSFNALLKTLEEPPKNIIFILATTDPQKLPKTIHSRCLQFHLQHFDAKIIAKHLANILTESNIPFEHEALIPISETANGSMRDALSLLEQSLALNTDTLNIETVTSMLGTVPDDCIYDILAAIQLQDKPAINKFLAQLSKQSYNYPSIINQILSTLCNISSLILLQSNLSENSVTIKSENKKSNTKNIEQLAQKINPEQCQLFIQIAIETKKEIELYPNHSTGFNIMIMRMLCFKIEENSIEKLITKQQNIEPATKKQLQSTQNNLQNLVKPQTNNITKSAQQILQTTSSAATQTTSNKTNTQNITSAKKTTSSTTHKHNNNNITNTTYNPTTSKSQSNVTSKVPLSELEKKTWPEIIALLPLKGLNKQVLSQSTMQKNSNNNSIWTIAVTKMFQTMLSDNVKNQILQLIHTNLNTEITLKFSSEPALEENITTPITQVKETTSPPITTKQQSSDPNLQELQKKLNATLIE